MQSVVADNQESIRAVSTTSFAGASVDQFLDTASDRLTTTIVKVGDSIRDEECAVFLELLRQQHLGLDFRSAGLQTERDKGRSTLMFHAEEARVIGGLVTARSRRTAAVVSTVIYMILLFILAQFVNLDRAPWTLPGLSPSQIPRALKWVQSGRLASWRS